MGFGEGAGESKSNWHAKATLESAKSFEEYTSCGYDNDAIEEQARAGLVFEDGSRYKGEVYNSLPWYVRFRKYKELRDRTLRKDIEDWSREELELITSHPLTYRLVTSWIFQLFVTITIFANIFVTAFRADSLTKSATGYVVAENLFTAIFLIEWVLNVYAEGLDFFLYLMNLFDSFLVFFAGVLPVWLLPAFGIELTGELGEAGNLLQIFRIMRLLKVQRLLKKLESKDLWMLIMGILASARSFMWAMVLLTIFMFVCAIFLKTVVGNNEEIMASMSDEIKAHYNSVPEIMWFLFAALTNGVSWEEVARPALHSRPYYWVYYAIFTCLGNFILLNLITAVIVEHAIDNANLDHEHEAQIVQKRKKKTINRIMELFRMCDEDNSGYIDKAEFDKTLKLRNMKRMIRSLELESDDQAMDELFRLVDVDESGTLSLEEFRNTFYKMLRPPSSKDVLCLANNVQQANEKLDYLLGFHEMDEKEFAAMGLKGKLERVTKKRSTRQLEALHLNGLLAQHTGDPTFSMNDWEQGAEVNNLKSAQSAASLPGLSPTATNGNGALSGFGRANGCYGKGPSLMETLENLSKDVKGISSRLDRLSSKVDTMSSLQYMAVAGRQADLLSLPSGGKQLPSSCVFSRCAPNSGAECDSM